jgi:hypothetical protein
MAPFFLDETGCFLRLHQDEWIEVVSQPRITPEGKAQADSKAQQPRQYVSI